MKILTQFTAIVLFFGGLVFPSHANFSSIYIFGDSLSSTTTNNGGASPYYYGQRYSNGRTWVEVLAQRQSLGANSITNVNWSYSSNNQSFYGNYSSNLVANIPNIPRASATNSLFIVWVANADFVGDMLGFGSPDKGTNLAAWTTAINQHLTNHFNIITNLYAKGCRTLIAPNAADVTTIPQWNNSGVAYRAFVRQRIISFNINYAAMLKQILANPNYAGLTIYSPDIFSLLDNVEANASSYGLTNALNSSGHITSVLGTSSLSPYALNGPGTNYIFWDYLGNPTACMGEIIADTVQQLISPVQISGLAQVNGSNQLNVVNMPVGLNGFLDNSTNLAQASWTTATSFNSLTTTQSIFVVTPPLPDGFGLGGGGSGGGSGGPPIPGGSSGSAGSDTNSTPYVGVAAQFYRLRFPYAWNWP